MRKRDVKILGFQDREEEGKAERVPDLLVECERYIEMLRLDTTEEAERVQVEIFRQMKPEERLQAGIDLAQTCRKLLEAGVRARHPEYDANQVKLAVIRLQLGEELFLKVYPEAKDVLP